MACFFLWGGEGGAPFKKLCHSGWQDWQEWGLLYKRWRWWLMMSDNDVWESHVFLDVGCLDPMSLKDCGFNGIYMRHLGAGKCRLFIFYNTWCWVLLLYIPAPNFWPGFQTTKAPSPNFDHILSPHYGKLGNKRPQYLTYHPSVAYAKGICNIWIY